MLSASGRSRYGVDEPGGQRTPRRPSSARIGAHTDCRVYIPTPEYPATPSARGYMLYQAWWQCTFLVLRQAEVAVPAGHQNHVISQVFALDL
jgi:hypothetical protein